MKISKAAFAAILLSTTIAAPAMADDADNGNTYLRVSGGVILPRDIDFDISGPGTLSFKNGWHASAALGYRITPVIAVEGEFTYLETDLDKFTSGGTTTSIDGTLNTVLGMVNVDFHPLAGDFDPYIGVGGGGAYTKIDINAIGGTTGFNSEDGGEFAAQGIAGFSYTLQPGTAIGVDYRYIWTDTSGEGASAYQAQAVSAHATFSF